MQWVAIAPTAGATARAGTSIVKRVVLTPAAALTTLTLKDATGGSVLLTAQAAASGNSVVIDLGDGLPFYTEVFAILVGASGAAYIGL